MTTYNTCCADYGLDTIEAGEWYMVHDEIWPRGSVARLEGRGER